MLKANEHLNSQIQSMHSRLEALEKIYTGEYSKANLLCSRNNYRDENITENRHLEALFNFGGGNKQITMIKMGCKKGGHFKLQVAEDKGNKEKLGSQQETNASGAINILQTFLS
jgi:hypothetical protein